MTQPVSSVTAVLPKDTVYTVNDSDVKVVDGRPSLLVDEIVSTDNSASGSDYRGVLVDKAVKLVGEGFPAMGENMFSAVMSQKYEGAEFADALIEMFGAQNVAILYQNTDHGVIATDVFTKQYEAGGGKVIMSETFIPGQTKDFSPVLSRIKEQDPDLFYVNASYNDCAQIFMQAKALNMDCQLVGPGMLLTEEFLDVVGNKIDGTIVMSSVPAFLPSVLESGELDAASKNFVDSYTAEYNEVPDGFAASAFDAVNIVLDAVAKVGTDTPALREELKTLRDYPGVSGYNMSFNEQKEMVKGIYLFEIQDGQFVRVK